MSGAGFVIDLHRCVGCGACVLACRLENGWSSETPWRRVLPLNLRRHPGGPTYFLSVACHHCEEPACLKACPSAAFEKRADGIVIHHDECCLGCRYCEMACPFGAPRFDTALAVVTKCDFCRGRVDRGDLPACIAACPTEALRALEPDPPEGSRAAIPGFVDPAGCRPSIRFQVPRSDRRAALLAAADKALGGSRRRRAAGRDR
jgi:Fe-S-cluster-containing dehydrogenase component